MKFAKVLQQVASELPELHDMFLRYKQLKKAIKAMPLPVVPEAGAPEQQPQDAAAAAEMLAAAVLNSNIEGEDAAHGLSAEERHFISMLNQEICKFNRFFMDREEDLVIQLQSLSEDLEAAHLVPTGGSELTQLQTQLVEFHGSCILLLHWSLLNYAAVAKILKKHDKRTGVLLRAPYLSGVLHQPFNSTSIMSRLVRRAEELVAIELGGSRGATVERQSATMLSMEQSNDALMNEPSGVGGHVEVDGSHQQSAQVPLAAAALRSQRSLGAGALVGSDEEASSGSTGLPVENIFCRRTQLALETWETLSRTAVTPSTILEAGHQALGGHLQSTAAPCSTTGNSTTRAALAMAIGCTAASSHQPDPAQIPLDHSVQKPVQASQGCLGKKHGRSEE